MKHGGNIYCWRRGDAKPIISARRPLPLPVCTHGPSSVLVFALGHYRYKGIVRAKSKVLITWTRYWQRLLWLVRGPFGVCENPSLPKILLWISLQQALEVIFYNKALKQSKKLIKINVQLKQEGHLPFLCFFLAQTAHKYLSLWNFQRNSSNNIFDTFFIASEWASYDTKMRRRCNL